MLMPTLCSWFWKICTKVSPTQQPFTSSGLTNSSSSVIDHLKTAYQGDPQVALAYFYFSFNDEQKQTAVGMMESIIKQICCCRPDTPLSIKALEDLKARGHRPDLKTLQESFAEILRGFSNVFVIIDALDECPDSDLDHGREVLLDCLANIHGERLRNLHMFLTSRREKDIEASYCSLETDSDKWDIDLSAYQPAIDSDIGLFIDRTLSSNSYKSWPSELKDEARIELIEKAVGMYAARIASTSHVKRTTKC